ncbi:unnamed protein product [Trichobilharzia szidati]|nr:unnamed protein product [Trichobilharzia szidati]CAH8876211.1 unnamed protein product [Trichobilharzia szidati]
MTSETAEQKITHALQIVTGNVEKYFTQLVEDICCCVITREAVWFEDTIKKVIPNFEKSTSDGIAEILSQYNVNNKALLLAEANETLKRSESWRPSGDPEKDIRAHLLPLNKSFLASLTPISRKLRRKTRRRFAKLKRLRCTLHDEITEFQSIAEKLQKLTLAMEEAPPHLPPIDTVSLTPSPDTENDENEKNI